MSGSDVHTSKQIGATLIAVGASLAAASIATALVAAEHMASVSLCGPLTGHCLLCAAATASLVASSGVIASGVLLRRSSRCVQTRASRL